MISTSFAISVSRNEREYNTTLHVKGYDNFILLVCELCPLYNPADVSKMTTLTQIFLDQMMAHLETMIYKCNLLNVIFKG